MTKKPRGALWRINEEAYDQYGSQFNPIQRMVDMGVLIPVLPNGSEAAAALRSDVWQEDKKGLRPFEGLEAHAYWLTMSQARDVVGWDITRAARIAIEAALGDTDEQDREEDSDE